MDVDITPEDESRRKRLKLSDNASQDEPSLSTAAPAAAPEDAQAVKEAEVGITRFVSPDTPGFLGIVKKRYTDFLVNEILLDGTVLHLKSLSLPSSSKPSTKPEKKPEEKLAAADTGNGAAEKGTASADVEGTDFTVSEEDRMLLDECVGADVTKKVIQLHNRCLKNPTSRPGELGRVKSDPIQDKDARTKVHQIVRRVFASRLETTTEDDGAILFSAAPKRQRGGNAGNRGDARQKRTDWGELGGEYLHFTIYKENKDTMEVMTYLARQTKIGPKSFQFAGTKDRRGVTVQRASVYRASAARLMAAGKTLRNAVIGDFKYEKHKLELGDLQGNEFVITLRECQFPEEDMQSLAGAAMISKASEFVAQGLRDLRKRGYFNYYGLQRFGSFATRTDTVGVRMLQGDFEGACNAILEVPPTALAAALGTQDANVTTPVGSDDIARAEAIHVFRTTGRINEALDKLPRKFSGEAAVIRHLGRHKTDYYGALQGIPRNLRLMYVHAYQSYVWNFAVSERWRLYGDKVVPGDMILVNEAKGVDTVGADQVDADGEVVLLPDAGDSAPSLEDAFVRARPLTSEEAASGQYSIFDIVLPLPGFDVVYPPNELTAFYERFMASEQGGKLDPHDMRRKWKDISLSGGYRKILSRPGPDYSFEVKTYTDDNEQFVSTDRERLGDGSNAPQPETERQPASNAAESSTNASEKLAVVVKFQLGASQYATMALRELMKGGATAYKPDFGGRM